MVWSENIRTIGIASTITACLDRKLNLRFGATVSQLPETVTRNGTVGRTCAFNNPLYK